VTVDSREAENAGSRRKKAALGEGGKVTPGSSPEVLTFVKGEVRCEAEKKETEKGTPGGDRGGSFAAAPKPAL